MQNYDISQLEDGKESDQASETLTIQPRILESMNNHMLQIKDNWNKRKTIKRIPKITLTALVNSQHKFMFQQKVRWHYKIEMKLKETIIEKKVSIE